MSCALHISFFPTIKFVISIVTLIYTAMVRHFKQFLMRKFIEKQCFEIFAPFFVYLPKLQSHAVKSGSKLSAAKLVYCVLPSPNNLRKVQFKDFLSSSV